MSIKKLVVSGALATAAVAFILAPAVASADSDAERSEKKAGPQGDQYVWIASDNAQEPYKKLHLQPVPLSSSFLESSIGGGNFSPREDNLAGSPGGKDERQTDAMDTLPSTHAYDAGFEIETHRLLNPEMNPSPAVILLNERLDDEKLYFGFLSITIRW